MVKNLLKCRRPGFDPWVGKIPWKRKWQPTPVFLPGESHEQRNLAGYGLLGCKESDTTERLKLSNFTYFQGHLGSIGVPEHTQIFSWSGKLLNPFWYSCLENSMD